MDSEEQLRERLRKIEALFAGAATVGERAAAGLDRFSVHIFSQLYLVAYLVYLR